MSEVTVSTGTYRAGKLTPKQQLHIARRIAPLILNLKGGEGEITAAFAEHIGKLSDADVDAIIDPCMAVCQRKIADGAWAPIIAPNGSMMYEDIGVKDIFELTVAVIKENLGNFFPDQGGVGALASVLKGSS